MFTSFTSRMLSVHNWNALANLKVLCIEMKYIKRVTACLNDSADTVVGDCVFIRDDARASVTNRLKICLVV